MRKTYRERAIEKARKEVMEAESEYKSAKILQIQACVTSALGMLCIVFIGLPMLWNWLVKSKPLDSFVAFMLAALPLFVLMAIWIHQMAKSYVLFGQVNTGDARRKLEALQRNYGGQRKGDS
jgi:hypothetical protein